MDKPQEEHCSHCGQRMPRIHKHHLNTGLVKALYAMRRASGMNPIRVSNIHGLTHNQLCNFTKLKYWRLIETVPVTDTQTEDGVWALTDKGARFLENELAIPERVSTRLDEVQEYTGEMLKATQVWEGYLMPIDWARNRMVVQTVPLGQEVQQQLL